MSRPQRISVLGATGSIGLSTLDVVQRHPDRYEAFALTGFSRLAELEALCLRHRPVYAVVPEQAAAIALQGSLAAAGVRTRVLFGEQALCEVASAPEVDMVMAAIVGAAGLPSTLAAVEAGKRVLLANKEALVMSGALFMQAVKRSGAVLLPIDSEHNAIFQSLPRNYADGLERVGVRRILLTASGGPFRETPLEQLASVTPEQACAHPNWSMGRKISVDSASMMNKGLELIEACWLFDAQPSQVEVVIHPQSVIHSMVDYVDGSVIAQLGNPDMRTPISYAMAWPERIDSGVSPLDMFAVGRLVPAPRRAALPLPAPGEPGRGNRRQRPGHAECRERGGRGRISRAAHPLQRHRGYHRGRAEPRGGDRSRIARSGPGCRSPRAFGRRAMVDPARRLVFGRPGGRR